METIQRHTMAECAMASFLNGQYYQSVCCTAALVYMGEQLRSHERHLMCDIFLGIINKFIIEKIELEKQLEAKRQALQQISEPTEEQKQVVEAAKEGINILLWHLTMYISEMLVITIEALNYFTTDDHEPKVFLYRLMGECLGIMCQLVNTDDDVVNTAASIAYAFGMVYGFHLPPTHPSNLDNIISYCIFSVRNLRNLDAAIVLASYAISTCTEELILESTHVQATRHRLHLLQMCLDVWTTIRETMNSDSNTNENAASEAPNATA
ncbi:uncharacterized protein LOC117591699 [Drosophila guanche]|uniref:14-3-3 domain-containing protein n=2 Tax=Drosophila guanche TaxID=7266 RepID=A0A3B0KTU5_DROGU|nr:uncharacterized protein LOC117591639 [Drosophila guanche]XP_034140914.1 uncharacterized protein LOC117591699 [Drosophila guanche]SPP90139.1 Hypothetical predicted protein [Drosophila guanche]SPP90189.1 Hypothetical predicted protein [Drosophila guanche]